jgi:Cu/Ag efflux protein CusF
MKPIATLIAVGIVISLAMAAHAATDAAPGPSLMPAAAPVTGAGNDRSLESLRGVVASVDERNDRITLRLPSNASVDLKVRDGLLFNAVRYGDQVEVVVEDIDGAKTIVGLGKQ